MKKILLLLSLFFITFSVVAEEQSEIKNHARLLMAVCLDTTGRFAKKNTDVSKMKKEELEAFAKQIMTHCMEKTADFLYKECYKDQVFSKEECDSIFKPTRAQI